MRIVIFSQSDSIAIPSNIMKLSHINNVQILEVFEILDKGSLQNKKALFVRGFGLMQSLKLGIIILWKKIINLIDIATSYSVIKSPHSIYAASKRCNAKYRKINNPNDNLFLNYLEKMNIDICVSFSAPSIFKNKLLSLPSYGCINLHCSLLPQYAGLLPSFWTLYHREKKIGSTVHFMDSKIDNGKILAQKEIDTPNNPTMYKVIKATKNSGGDLICDVVKQMIKNNLKPKNKIRKKMTYFTWPTVHQIREFKKQGGRLI